MASCWETCGDCRLYMPMLDTKPSFSSFQRGKEYQNPSCGKYCREEVSEEWVKENLLQDIKTDFDSNNYFTVNPFEIYNANVMSEPKSIWPERKKIAQKKETELIKLKEEKRKKEQARLQKLEEEKQPRIIWGMKRS